MMGVNLAGKGPICVQKKTGHIRISNRCGLRCENLSAKNDVGYLLNKKVDKNKSSFFQNLEETTNIFIF